MTPAPDTKEQASTENCSTCAPAHPHSAPKGLPPKAKIDVRHVILVLSGKGGVGKSTVSVNLVYALASHGKKVGLLDLDFHGPNIPKMLGIEDQRPTVLANTIEPVHVTGNLAVMSMAFLLPDTSTPVVWRGPMKMGAIQQFLSEVNWGALDYLVVDLPPGTGDEALTIVQLAPNVRGAVIVTTPQDVAVMDATKAAKFIEKLELPGPRGHREHERHGLPPLRRDHRSVRHGGRKKGGWGSGRPVPGCDPSRSRDGESQRRGAPLYPPPCGFPDLAGRGWGHGEPDRTDRTLTLLFRPP